MKKFILLCAVIMLTGISTYAQSDAVVSGKIIDKNTKESIPFASVAILEGNGAIINGSMSDNTGHFTIKGLSSGNYSVSISTLGYQPLQISVLIGKLNKYYDLGKLELETSVTEIKEVTITGEQNEIASGLEKKSFNIANEVAQSGGSVVDAMKAMPGITFDQDGKAILRGSDKVVVLIDGKQSSLTGYGNQKGLDNIPASNIERIEIINNPSAKYDANGMAGIINIIYKTEKEAGLHGSVGFTYGLGAISKAKADLPTELRSFSPTPKYIPSLDLNMKTDKWSAFLQSEVMLQQRLPNNEFTTRYYDDGRVIASQVPENRKQTHYIVKGGADYYINDNNTLSFSGIYDWEIHVDTAQVPYIDLSTNLRNRYINWNEEEITGYMNYMLHYEHKFKQTGHELHAHLLYSKGWEDETYDIHDSSAIRQNGTDVTSVLGTEYTTSLSVDYTKPLAAGRLETGTKIQVRDLPVDYTQKRGENSILYEGLGSWSKWGETIYAGYANWVQEKAKYDIEAGLRAEYTSVFYDMDKANAYYTQNDSYNYFKFFPNIRLTYKINERNKLSVFYNQRIDRPGEPELRMYAKSDDHELVKVGNPYLRPQYTQSTELAYKTSWTSGSVYLSGYYKYITDPYMRVYTIDESNLMYDVIVKSYANTGKAENLGLEVVFSQDILDAWKLSGNMNFYRNNIEAYTGTLLFPYEHTFDVEETTDNTWNFKLINTFDLPFNMQAQVTGLYIAPKNIPQGRELSRSSIDLGVKKKMWQDRGEFSLVFTDIFNQYGLREELKGEGFNAKYENYYETQILRLGFKYKF